MFQIFSSTVSEEPQIVSFSKAHKSLFDYQMNETDFVTTNLC